MNNRWMKWLLPYGLTALLLVAPLSAIPAEAHTEKSHHTRDHKGCLSPKAAKLFEKWQKLWIEHALWTNNYIVSNLEGLDNKEQVLARLLRNQRDIGDAIKPYYGEVAGDQLGKLLTEHIMTGGKVFAALQSGNEADLQQANKAWYGNADEIAALLSGLNPHWSEKQLKDLLYQHLQLTAADVVANLHKEWEQSIHIYDDGQDHLILLANVLAEGILKQFPDQFK
ncbi:glycosyltransferase [Paenibacillus radicis (ex Gao et al. 2016)]|uniref:Glycosyltransferase n=1 Tax=Paenibacillus radicis (ex Gao et al. 2016) TaxID=1737354 RepID=A0A917M1F5_9BACL|nr:glycosyltransferase [Paenibacillus radicis (ex Gao et al. 2016)]GGG73029.1 hypothetical protein GCM10010918_31300 [Paenibacillus radicis (ex Gao et al. 2016)]